MDKKGVLGLLYPRPWNDMTPTLPIRMDEDEYEIIQINAGCTDEQIAALRKALYELFGIPDDSGDGD